VSYESRLERFEAVGPDGQQRAVEFRRAGFLTAGDRPELYFFRVAGEQEEIVVGISGSALQRFEQGRRRLTREEKIDVAGLWLKKQIAVGAPRDSSNLFVRDEQLAELAGELGFPA
jgi:hypothetical protein